MIVNYDHTVIMIVNYDHTVIVIVNYNRNTFTALATRLIPFLVFGIKEKLFYKSLYYINHFKVVINSVSQ
jgi:hypothetical protein